MYDDGYQYISNIDHSYTVIKQMQELYKEKYSNMSYKHMDARQLTYEDGSFDAVIDKACFDSILCGDGSGPSADQMLSEIHRVLAPNGVYICVSYGVKENRQHYFSKKEYDWTVFHHMVAKPTISTSAVVADQSKDEKKFHWVYIMRKQAK
jgi:EEF1A lysine methyltransferase 4